jgi:glycosyltransferase involved in cell wall biosynthesis
VVDYPLVSCIMPTCNRRAFVVQAIKYFRQQDYPNKELIIVDNSNDDSIDRLVTGDESICYDWQPDPCSVGEMRNIACSFAMGEIICFQDDDDWYSPHRLSQQVAPILEGRADVTGCKMLLLLRTRDTTLWRCPDDTHRALFGFDVRCGTLMYKASYWQQGHKYAHVSQGEDVEYLRGLLDRGARLERIVDPTSYICVRHGNNVTDDLDVSGWERIKIEEYIPAEDVAFYRFLSGTLV